MSNTDPSLVGHTLQLNFVSTLSLNLTAPGPGAAPFAQTQDKATGTNIANPGQSDFSTHSATAGVGAVGGGVNSFQTSGWDSLVSLGGGNYRGTWHLDIPIVLGEGYIAGMPGSFYYQVSDVSQVGGQSNSGVADAADPSQFMSTTLPDVGNVTPESLGVNVTFASGIVSPNVSAVPEPSSLVLAAIGTVVLMGYGWWRRTTAKA